MLRSRRGVIDSTISLRMASSFWLPKRRFSTGSSPTPGTLLAVPRSSSLIRPASTCVSPSFRRNTVDALRVPIWYACVPVLLITSLTTFDTSRLILMATSSSR
ncbi:hypothetical protein D3C72_1637500 [compost metagenome]